ncbi:FAD/NAD-P-binding domain-containing protein [Clavulina sp. PMI_390]|nr:FAD/NAD-P-binding domain-containing protein [Clavulina sp. PMI_390]
MRTSLVRRAAAAASSASKHKVVIVGAGTAGLSTANQIYNKFAADGHRLNPGDIAVIDAAEWHNYQPGWTLVGAGLKDKYQLRQPVKDLIPPHITLVSQNVATFSPESNSLTTENGQSISYETLIVAPGLKINWDGIKGLPKALADPKSGVSSIYSFDTADKAWSDIEGIRSGKALFTQPAGVVKCAGAPQKIMWMAWDRFRRTGRSAVETEFATGLPVMFGVPKYSEALNALRIKRNIPAAFAHNLVAIDTDKRIASFKTPDSDKLVEKEYTILHVVPPMGAPDFVKNSPLADGAGFVDVDQATLQHKKFANVFSLGDASSLPTSKTAAAITAQAPILVNNLTKLMTTGKVGTATYDGYTSCPLLTGYDQLMLAEFLYGGKPSETFARFGLDQAVPRRVFFHLKKDFFPYVYFSRMVRGTWYGRNGFSAPSLVNA